MFYSCVNSPYEMICTVCSVISFCCKYIKRYFKTLCFEKKPAWAFIKFHKLK